MKWIPVYLDWLRNTLSLFPRLPLFLANNINNFNVKLIMEFFYRKKDGEAVKSIKSLKDRIAEQKNDATVTLVVSHSNEEDTGNYSCVVVVKQTEITNATIRAVCKYFSSFFSYINCFDHNISRHFSFFAISTRCRMN